ncbi:hypothetical protein CEXT_8911 [Caerostris extrusa]|uniref:Uncharacterized protein n=1 Tax=Caerostris extrusa TaxID=172846 RepID=A0AAV4U755_CAEEX|nr:hypothetical protein CEXT_8911 [Caerostris extrusa]
MSRRRNKNTSKERRKERKKDIRKRKKKKRTLKEMEQNVRSTPNERCFSPSPVGGNQRETATKISMKSFIDFADFGMTDSMVKEAKCFPIC